MLFLSIVVIPHGSPVSLVPAMRWAHAHTLWDANFDKNVCGLRKKPVEELCWK